MILAEILDNRINMPDIRRVVQWCAGSPANRAQLFELAMDGPGLRGANALWCLTHLRKSDAQWLQSQQNLLIDRLLDEPDTARRRMLLQLLREQDYAPDSIRTDFLDFCLSKINAEAEAYAVRCFALYIACKLCCHYPELVAELRERLDLLSLQPLSPGLKCARRKVQAALKAIP